MKDVKKIEIAVRIITIKDGKVLLVSNDRDNFYYFVGGKINHNETIEECAQRELKEETGLEVNLKVQKILYTQELILKQNEKHKIEFFVLAVIDKFSEIEGRSDHDHNGTDHLTWVDVDKIPENTHPKFVTERLKEDYNSNFERINIPHYIQNE